MTAAVTTQGVRRSAVGGEMIGPQSELDGIAPLPRGRHDLSADEVSAHQRERILGAVSAVIADEGYWSLTVEQVIALAGVSRSTFYVHFENKLEAALAAHEWVLGRYLAEVQVACRAQVEWAMKVSAALGATLDFIVSRPRQAQILSVGSMNADAALAVRVATSQDHIAGLLAGLRPHSPHAAELPESTERFLVAAIASVLATWLRRGGEPEPAVLAAELLELTLIPYYGAAEAARIAGRA
jgi:AcrR family transcriptional regulator